MLQKCFGDVPESLINTINKVEDMSILEQIHLESISVNFLTEFSRLIQNSISPQVYLCS
ncbi:hypothetical protein [Anabaena sp. FACHB-1237]|uniref:hypothetical protein n=1 Tax=Anabaena sp. FACHB-1237 TaxID=2692769 RepID=UPI0018F00A37|nr:hypothetical protein [Anabaena sp. FACHB-1237]